MNTITELREALANWAVGEPFQNAFEIMQLLTDPTPITEAGLRELGFWFSIHNDEWILGDLIYDLDVHRLILAMGSFEVKTVGQLRMLLLAVGE